MKFVALDLEMNQPSGKIIQIGAAIGDSNIGKIESDFSVFINPNEPLSEFIIGLTGISDEQVKYGYTIQTAYDMLLEYIKDSHVFVNPVTWGGNDAQELYEQLSASIPGSSRDNLNWPFGHRHIDVKTLFVSWRFANNQKAQGGLGKSLTKVGMTFEGRAHNATCDSINTLRMYFKFLEKMQGI